MKKTVLLILLSVLGYGYDAEVKKADVTLLVNDAEVSHKTGEKFTLQAGDIICFKEGKGRVVIRGKDYKKQISKHTKGCKHLPGDMKKSSQFAQHMTHQVMALFSKAEEEKVTGVSRKAVETAETFTTPITLAAQAKYLAIENESWPLPVTLEVLDESGKPVESMVNEEDVITSFVLPKGMLKEGYTIKVTNAFDELLVNSIIHMEEKK